jgi:hypothetical protein
VRVGVLDANDPHVMTVAVFSLFDFRYKTHLRDPDTSANTDPMEVSSKPVSLSIIGAFTGFAWIYEADFFSIFFATAAAIAIVEAVRRSM